MKLLNSMLVIGCIAFSGAIYADAVSSLTLTDAEMQKLKKYFPAEEQPSLIWKGDPIAVSLPVGKEKRLVFPDSISVDLKGALNTDQVRIINNDKSIYLTALKSFESTRIYVTLNNNESVIMIDLSADTSVSSNTQKIEIKKNITNTSVSSETLKDTYLDQGVNNDISSVDLIRFAWQQVYAPKRLLMPESSYTRAAMHTEKFVSDLVYGDKVIAHPEISWMSGNHYITVVLLRNKYTHKTSIDVAKDLCGEWDAVTLYPRSILRGYGNTEKDSTYAFLVSVKPFGETIGVCHGNA
jgi:integrating conjugative element protein (TIGR03749 family)